MYIDIHNENDLQEYIIGETGLDEDLIIIGKVDASTTRNKHHIITVQNVRDITDDNLIGLQIHRDHCNSRYDNCDFIQGDGYLSTAPSDDKGFVFDLMRNEGITIVEDAKAPHYIKLARVAEVLTYLISKKPIYGNIIHNDEVVGIDTILFQLHDYEHYINQLLFAVGNLTQLSRVAEQILENITHETDTNVYNPTTQEEQVSLFLEFNNKLSDDVVETVSDDLINTLKETDVYQTTMDKLTSHGFKLSPTQQFNSLQHLGLVLQNENKVMYNLSDMGSGKTLMTVETIVLAQEFNAQTILKQLTEQNINLERVELQLPTINIIAPTLSLNSSWINTFKLFWDLTQVDEYHYQYSMTDNGITLIGNIYLSGFTVNNGKIYVPEKLPHPLSTQNFLIIDEIHQLIARGIRADKFVERHPNYTIDIYNDYYTFVLSGTLANLTTANWFNMINFLSLPDKKWTGGYHTTAELAKRSETMVSENTQELRTFAETITTLQRREFDPSYVGETIDVKQRKLTNREYLFHLMYGTNIVDFTNRQNTDLSHLLRNNVDLIIEPQLLSTPNFELFYKLVSPSVVTAESIQIATELFGEQAEQHKAQVIKTKSSLTAEDLNILKTLHKIVSDSHIYKSQSLATRLANAILNLNDGLSKTSIYDLLNSAATTNTSFLTYLTTLDVQLLEKIQTSGLIQSPKLEDTEKFKILVDLLDNHKEDTFLIVVNTPDVVIKLSNALGIGHLTLKEMRDELNYQYVIDELYTKQNIVIVPQYMIKSSLDLVQANHLIQYQLNSDISDIIQTQNRINRIGQTRETRATYIATDVLQENIIELFLETYRNIKVAHKGIVELFVDMEQQIDVVSDYLANALDAIEEGPITHNHETVTKEVTVIVDNDTYVTTINTDTITAPVLWYMDKLITQSETGETIELGTMPIQLNKPTLVTLK